MCTNLVDTLHNDSASQSEIVLPLEVNGQIIGVLDIDSPIFWSFF